MNTGIKKNNEDIAGRAYHLAAEVFSICEEHDVSPSVDQVMVCAKILAQHQIADEVMAHSTSIDMARDAFCDYLYDRSSFLRKRNR